MKRYAKFGYAAPLRFRIILEKPQGGGQNDPHHGEGQRHPPRRAHLLVQLGDDLHVAASQFGLLFLQQALHLALLSGLWPGGRLSALHRRLHLRLMSLQEGLAIHCGTQRHRLHQQIKT